MKSFYLKNVQKNMIIKSLCFDISYKKTDKPDYKWLRVTTTDYEPDYEWQQVTTSVYEPDYEWLQVTASQRVTASQTMIKMPQLGVKRIFTS